MNYKKNKICKKLLETCNGTVYNKIVIGGDAMFVWIKSNANQYILTLTNSSITLNASAANLFQHVRWCMIGIDGEQMRLAIRPVTKEEIDKQMVDVHALHKVSIGKGYGRISSKACMEELSQLLELELDTLKIEAKYDEENQYLIADLKTVNEGM